MQKLKNNKKLDKLVNKLIQEKEKIAMQINELKADDPFSDPEHVNDNAAIDTEVREQSLHQIIEAQVTTLQNRLKDIANAILRIKKGRYGYCNRCDRVIPKARLELVPEAQYCVECEAKLKK